eukprot:s45_g42.t1
MWTPSFQRPAASSTSSATPASAAVAEELNEEFQRGLLVKLLAINADGSGLDKKMAQLLGLRFGRQPHHEGYQPLDWSLQEWPRDKDHESGKGIAGNWFTSASLVGQPLAAAGSGSETGTALYGCNRYACGRSMDSHKVLAVFQPFPIVGCGFVSDAGTNAAGEFTGCVKEWPDRRDGTVSRCLSSPDDCTFRRAGAAFGDEARGVWRVDRKFLSHFSLRFTGRFDPESSGARRFVEEQRRFNPKATRNQFEAGEKIHTMGYNEVMVQVGTPAMLFEEMHKDGVVPKRFNVNQLRLWQCRTNGIRAFARVQPPVEVDEHGRQVERQRYEVFCKMRDAYDKACGRTEPTPILSFDLSAAEKPFAAPDMEQLFPGREPVQSATEKLGWAG